MIEKSNLIISKIKMRKLTLKFIHNIYSHLKNESYFHDMCSYLTSK